MVRNRLAAKHMHQLVKQSCCRLFEKSVGITVIAHAIDNLTTILITFQELIQCFNILLQVMDYAVLTDNKGRKADCRHVILIMTSNAGAQFAHQASIGFSGQITAGEAMLKQVKKTFKPEFINRLSATVVFHDMDYGMASLILNKKLNELKNKLSARHVGMELSPEAYKHLLKLGFTKEYGAREMDRVITSQLKPLLMREILFGTLKTGGKVRVTAGNGELSLQVLKE